MKGKAILSVVLVVLFLVSIFPLSAFSVVADSHGGSRVFGSKPVVQADSTNLTSNTSISELSWTLGDAFPVTDGGTIFPTMAPSAYPPSYTTHWYAGSVYLISSATQNARTINMSITVPPSAPLSDEFYYVLLSAWDSAGSYDQLGFSNTYGTWGLTYSWTSGPPTNPTYHYSSNAMALSLGVAYTFNITTASGVTHFVAYQGSTQVWSLDAPTGGNYLILSYSYSGYYDYTDYEEVWLTHSLGGVPGFDFDFYNQFWVSTAGNGNAATWASFLSAAPSGVTVSISGNFVLVENPGSVTLLWKLTVVSARDSPHPSFGDNYYYDGSSVTCSVTSLVTENITVWTCSGWSGSGSVPSSGSGTSVTFTITQDSSIAWNWVMGTLAYFSVEPVAIAPLTDVNSSIDGLETPPTPSPVGQNFTVEIHLRNATSTNVPTGVSGVEVHFYFGTILTYAVPTGFVNELGQAGRVLTGPSLVYGTIPGFYDGGGNLVLSPPYTNGVYFKIGAASTSGPWWGADGLVAIINFQITKRPQEPLGEPTVTLQLENDYTDLADENAESVPHFCVQGTLTIDASPVVPTYLVVRGTDSRIYYRVSLGDSWGDWNVLPGATSDSPAASVYLGQLWIVVRGMDGNTLWYGYLTNPADPTSFSGWTLLSGATPSAPTLTSNGTTLCLVVKGEDNLIYYRIYSNSSWGDWAALPSGATLDSPAAAMLGDKLHVVVRGMDGYSLWYCYVNLTDSSFSGWTPLSGATQSEPVLAVDKDENKLCLAVTGLDGRIYWRTYDVAGQSWANWSAVPSGATPEGPAVTIFGGVLQIVAQGMDSSSIWQGNIDLSTISFSGWTQLDGSTPSAPTLTS